MKPVRRLSSLAVVGALGAATWGVGTSLVKDVRFAGAQEAVADARKSLATATDMSDLYKQVNHVMENSVVHITVSKTVAAQPQQDNPLFKFFGPDGTPRRMPVQPNQPQAPDDDGDAPQPGEREVATGSGVIMDAGDGWAWVVTNNHVVADASNVRITLNDGRVIPSATVVATDPKSDLAVVKFKADRIIAAKWGDSDKLEKGDIVVAFGSPFGFVGSMSHGIVSALNRDQVRVNESAAAGFAYENFIQVDAAINPGNSGGPLCNTHGEVVGINTAIASRSGSFSGIGFAIPSDQAKQVYDSLKTSGKVVRGYLGVQIADIHTDDPTGQIKEDVDSTGFKGDTGTLVRAVMANSPALNVLRLNDIITELNGQPLKSMTSFRTQIAAMQPGQKVNLKVWRVDPTKDGDEAKGALKDVEITLGTQPDGEIAQGGGTEKTAPGKSLQLTQFGVTVVTPTGDDLTAAGLPGESQGALVKEVRPGSLAQRIGIAPGDLITRIGPAKVTSADEAKAAFAKIDRNDGRGLRIDLLSKQGERMVRLPGRGR